MYSEWGDKKKFYVKFFTILFSLVTPFLMLILQGKLNSLSSYWNTPLQPLFILGNCMTSFIFLSLPKWRLSGIFLILLTIFSVEYYSSLHDIFATLFFIVNLYPLYLISLVFNK